MSAFSIADWYVGGSNPYLRLDISTGSLDATVVVDSRTAREIALDVLASQAPYLMFQPPNDSMKERKERMAGGSTMGASSDRLSRKGKRWPKLSRQRRQLLESRLGDLLDEYTPDEVLAVLREVSS